MCDYNGVERQGDKNMITIKQFIKKMYYKQKVAIRSDDGHPLYEGIARETPKDILDYVVSWVSTDIKWEFESNSYHVIIMIDAYKRAE